MYQLHYYPANANAAPHMLLEELGAKYELVIVERGTNAQKSASYLKINPNGRIPTLVDNGLVISEAAAIVLHLVDSSCWHAVRDRCATHRARVPTSRNCSIK